MLRAQPHKIPMFNVSYFEIRQSLSTFEVAYIAIMIYLHLIVCANLSIFFNLTLAELHVLALTSFIKLIKLLQNLMKLSPNHIMV